MDRNGSFSVARLTKDSPSLERGPTNRNRDMMPDCFRGDPLYVLFILYIYYNPVPQIDFTLHWYENLHVYGQILSLFFDCYPLVN